MTSPKPAKTTEGDVFFFSYLSDSFNTTVILQWVANQRYFIPTWCLILMMYLNAYVSFLSTKYLPSIKVIRSNGMQLLCYAA